MPDHPEGLEEAVKIARAFHDEYEAFAEMHGWETQEATRVAFDDLPEANRKVMVDTVLALLSRGVITTRNQERHHLALDESVEVMPVSKHEAALEKLEEHLEALCEERLREETQRAERAEAALAKARKEGREEVREALSNEVRSFRAEADQHDREAADPLNDKAEVARHRGSAATWRAAADSLEGTAAALDSLTKEETDGG
jgi:hypothetical protein